MRCYHIGYWHDSSSWVNLGPILAKNKKEAFEKAYQAADGLCDVTVAPITSLFELIPKEVVKYFTRKGELV